MVSDVLSVVANLKIPLLSWAAAAGAVGAKALSGGAKVASTALEGGDVKGAAVSAGIGVATTAVGVVIPGGGKLAGEAAEQAAKEAVKSTAKNGAATAFEESGAKAELTGEARNEVRDYQQQRAA